MVQLVHPSYAQYSYIQCAVNSTMIERATNLYNTLLLYPIIIIIAVKSAIVSKKFSFLW